MMRVALPGAIAVAVSLALAVAAAQKASESPLIDGTQTFLSTSPPLEESTPAQQRNISAVDVGPDGTVYVIQRQVKNPITVVTPDGRVTASWGDGMFQLPHGVRLDPQGNVWATDASPRSRVYKFTRSGNLLLEIDLGRYPPRHPNSERFIADVTFAGATDVAFAANGHIYVSDGYQNARIVEFDANGAFIREWGEPGKGPGQFRLPHGIAIGPDGTVYVAVRDNGRVQRFAPEGTYLGEWSYGDRLYSVDFGPRGDIYMGYLDAASRGLEGWVLRADAKTGQVLGRFKGPVHFVALGPSGSEFGGTQAGKVQVFTPAK